MIFDIYNTNASWNKDLLGEEYYEKIKPFICSAEFVEMKGNSKTYKAQVKLDSLEQLAELQNAIDSEIIIQFNEEKGFIEIYDDWRE